MVIGDIRWKKCSESDLFAWKSVNHVCDTSAWYG